tara:strand:+ start:751 stop:1035 length:285 start_codon:yes stop_codon:yes gene_type:complete
MNKRYDKVKSSRNSDGYWKKDTTYYAEIPESNDDIYVLTQFGDRFDTLSNQYYGTPDYWWYIAKANNMNFNNIAEGTQLRIPSRVSSDIIRNDI